MQVSEAHPAWLRLTQAQLQRAIVWFPEERDDVLELLHFLAIEPLLAGDDDDRNVLALRLQDQQNPESLDPGRRGRLVCRP
jgi:hypothetical protein